MCSNPTSPSQNRAIIFLLAVVALITVLSWSSRTTETELFHMTLEAEGLEHGKIVVGFFQVVSPLGEVLSVPIASRMPTLHELIHVADPLFLSLDNFLMLHCLPGLNDEKRVTDLD